MAATLSTPEAKEVGKRGVGLYEAFHLTIAGTITRDRGGLYKTEGSEELSCGAFSPQMWT